MVRLGLISLTLMLPISLNAKEFVYAENLAPSHLNPVLATHMNIVRIDELIFNALVSQGKNNKATEPGIAQSWEIDPQQQSILVKLNPLAMWHDGKRIVPEDVKFTIKTIQDPANASPDMERLSVIKEVDIIDENTIRITFTRPVREPLEKLNFKLLPSHMFSSKKLTVTDPFNQRPVGSGPYRFVSRSLADNTITLERVDGHPLNCTIEKIIMKEIPDREAQKSTFKYGGIDAIIKVHHNDIKELEQIRHVNIIPYAQNSWWYIAFNLGRQHCKDPRFRKGFIMALDREKTMKAHLGRGKVISGPYAPTTAYYNHNVKPLPFDIKGAISVLNQAGYVLDDGVLKKDGRPVKLTLAVAPGVAVFQEVVLDIQSALKQIGISLDVKSSFDTRSWKKEIEDNRNFDLALDQWVLDEQASIYEIFHSKGRYNFIGYRNQIVDNYLEQMMNTIDPVVAQTLGWKVHEVLAEDLPYAFLWSLEFSTAIWDKIKNVRIHPYYYFSFVCDWR